MTTKKLVPIEKFREVALLNGYEVFDEAQVADYAKDAMMKSRAGVLSQKDKDEFAVEMAGLTKAICTKEDGSQCTLYYRKPLVDWKIDGNGVVMKGIAGTYTDTPENRKLNRVGQAYVSSPDVIKSIYGVKNDVEEGTVNAEMVEQASFIRKSCAVVAADADRRLALGEIDEELCKSVKTEVGMYLTSWGDTLNECCDVVKSEDLSDVREDLADARAAFVDIVKAAHGRYADNAKNRRLHRVGQEYGKAGQKEFGDGRNVSGVSKIMEGFRIQRSSYSDFSKMSIEKTPGGNWRLYYDGRDTGTTMQSSVISEENAKKSGLWKNGGSSEDEGGEKPSRNGDSVKRDISILEENKDKIVEKYGQEAYDKKIEVLKKEGDDYEQKETVKQLKDRADKQDAEEEGRRKAEKRAKRQERRRARHAAKREAAKKAKEEAEAKAKAEAEEKEKQAAEKKNEPSAEEIAEKVKQFPKGWERKANGDDSDRWAVVLEDKMSPEEFDALYDENKSKKQWKKDWTDAIAKYLSVDEVKELMGKAKGPTYDERQVAAWKSKVDDAKTPDEALNVAVEAYKAFKNDKRMFDKWGGLMALSKNPIFSSLSVNIDNSSFDDEDDTKIRPFDYVDKYVQTIERGATPKEAKAYIKKLLSEAKEIQPDDKKILITPRTAFNEAHYPYSTSVWIDAYKKHGATGWSEVGLK